MLSNRVCERIRARDSFGEWNDYTHNYDQHVALKEHKLPANSVEEWGDLKQIVSSVLVLRQALVHRAIGLFEGALHAAASDHFYSMVLSIRGHFETTASLGYLHSRLQSFKRATIDPPTFHRDIVAQILGSRDDTLPDAPKAKQILDMLKHADKSVSVNLLKGSAREYDVLTDSYLWLSEFCHPNRHSNSVSFDIDKAVPEFLFRHGKPMRDRECKTLEYLLLSGPIFVELYGHIEVLVSEVLA